MSLEDYFLYLPEPLSPPLWGCNLLGAGRTLVRAGESYPPKRHPDDHHFDWQTGRRLHAFQIVHIMEGRGLFESAPSSKPQILRAGSVIILYPGIWHRYRPDEKTGWTEQWLEGNGPAFDQISGLKQPNPAQPILSARPEIAEAFHDIHCWIKRDPLVYQPVLSALLLQVLALIICPETSLKDDHDARIRRAMTEITDRNDEKIGMRRLAKKHRLTYSVFRNLFTRQAGMSPKQYQMQIRLRRARALLLNSNLSVKEIAALLGFHTLAHFSNYFRLRHGCSPRLWRRTVENNTIEFDSVRN